MGAENILGCYRQRYPATFISSAQKNIAVYWGHWSIVQAELNCMKVRWSVKFFINRCDSGDQWSMIIQINIIIKSNWIYLQTQRIRVWRSVLSIRPVCKSLFNRQWMVCGQWERKILRSQLSSEERTTVSKIFSRLGLWLETVGDWWLHHILETIIRWSPLQHCACFRFFIRITKELN